ncbi:MAG: substrate-binding domain-containing protein [Tepidisphaeraceae bacterium]
MTKDFRRIAIVMHRWVGYLHGVQLGIADYAVQHPDWLWTHVLPEPQHWDLLKGQPLHGVIAYVEADYVDELRALRVPVVDVANWRQQGPFPRVVPDDDAIGVLAADYLTDLGLKHLATIGFRDAAFYAIRRDGFIRRARQLQRDVLAWSSNDALDMRTWLGQLPRPVGLFCGNDGLAAEALEICRHAGIRVPEDVCVLGVDNDELIGRMTHPPLSSIAVHSRKIGFEAARLLDDLINHVPAPTDAVRLPPVGVVARQSTNLLAIEDPDVLAGVRYIRDNVHKNISVQHLLRVIPVNRRFLERRFKTHLGRSPLQEIRRARLEKAKELLSRTDLSMPAVAKRSGFPNPERLANVFHEAMGLTPTAYRRKFRLHDFMNED